MIESELQQKLKHWADEYGGGRYEYFGFNGRNILQTLIEHRGEVPDSRGYVAAPTRTAADEVQDIVVEMQSGGRFKQAMVLRAEWFNLDAPIEQKLSKLYGIGLSMSRAGFYSYLREATAYVDGAIEALRRAHDPFRHHKDREDTCV